MKRTPTRITRNRNVWLLSPTCLFVRYILCSCTWFLCATPPTERGAHREAVCDWGGRERIAKQHCPGELCQCCHGSCRHEHGESSQSPVSHSNPCFWFFTCLDNCTAGCKSKEEFQQCLLKAFLISRVMLQTHNGFENVFPFLTNQQLWQFSKSSQSVI